MTTLSYQSLFYIARPSGEVSDQQPWQDLGGQVQSYQPQPIRPLARAAAMAAATGLFLVLTPPPAPPALQTADYPWFEYNPSYRLSPKPRAAAVEGQSQFGIFTNAFWGWTQEYAHPPKAPRPSRGAIVPRDDGTHGTFARWINVGWEIQPPPPPHRRVERFGAIAPKDDGTQQTLQRWINDGWEIQPWQPFRIQYARATVNNIGAPRVEFRPAQGLQTADYAFGYDEPFVNPRKTFERAGALAAKSDGISARYERWFSHGFEQQSPPQPPRPNRYTIESDGDSGIAAPFISALLTAQYAWGYSSGEITYKQVGFLRSAVLKSAFDPVAQLVIVTQPAPSNLRIVYADLTARSVLAGIADRTTDVDITNRTIASDISARSISVSVVNRSVDVDVTDRET